MRSSWPTLKMRGFSTESLRRSIKMAFLRRFTRGKTIKRKKRLQKPKLRLKLKLKLMPIPRK